MFGKLDIFILLQVSSNYCGQKSFSLTFTFLQICHIKKHQFCLLDPKKTFVKDRVPLIQTQNISSIQTLPPWKQPNYTVSVKICTWSTFLCILKTRWLIRRCRSRFKFWCVDYFSTNLDSNTKHLLDLSPAWINANKEQETYHHQFIAMH